MAITKVTNSVVGSGSATDGYVLTADGSGNSAWEAAAGGVAGIVSSADATAITIDSSENVAIGIASPDQKLHVFKGSAGSIDSAGNSVLTIENSTDNILQFLNPSSTIAQVRFGDEGDNGIGFINYFHSTDAMTLGSGGSERLRIDSSGNVGIGGSPSYRLDVETSAFDAAYIATSINSVGGGVVLILNRSAADGDMMRFQQGGTTEGTIVVSGSTVSYNGFSGNHESSGINSSTPIGTVVSTIDELDVYSETQTDKGNDKPNPKAGQTRADHAKIKISDTEGDTRVYGILNSFNADGKAIVTSVGIGSIKVTGACNGGDLLESNGDGTAKVQSDDIVRSKTIGKVTIGNSDTGVKLVSCVLYCG